MAPFADWAGGLALAFMDENGNYVYSGNVGTGFTHADRQELEESPEQTTGACRAYDHKMERTSARHRQELRKTRRYRKRGHVCCRAIHDC